MNPIKTLGALLIPVLAAATFTTGAFAATPAHARPALTSTHHQGMAVGHHHRHHRKHVRVSAGRGLKIRH